MITISVNLPDYCKGCPYIELELIAESLAPKVYGCENSELCSRLWEFLQTKK